MNGVRGPTDKQRTLVTGRTGSGKSQFSIALLATRNWHQIPWVIIDYKGEDLLTDIIEAVPNGTVKLIKPTDNPPKRPGLYYMRPLVEDDDDAMKEFLKKIHRQGKVGIYIDEGYALPNSSAWTNILVQGRTLRIPLIYLYQRPVHMSRFAVSQSDFRAVFDQDDDRDADVMKNYIKPVKLPNGGEITVRDRLPPYHCLWYDVGQGQSHLLTPAPSREAIIDHFVKRLTKKTAGVLV